MFTIAIISPLPLLRLIFSLAVAAGTDALIVYASHVGKAEAPIMNAELSSIFHYVEHTFVGR